MEKVFVIYDCEDEYHVNNGLLIDGDFYKPSEKIRVSAYDIAFIWKITDYRNVTQKNISKFIRDNLTSLSYAKLIKVIGQSYSLGVKRCYSNGDNEKTYKKVFENEIALAKVIKIKDYITLNKSNYIDINLRGEKENYSCGEKDKDYVVQRCVIEGKEGALVDIKIKDKNFLKFYENYFMDKNNIILYNKEGHNDFICYNKVFNSYFYI